MLASCQHLNNISETCTEDEVEKTSQNGAVVKFLSVVPSLQNTTNVNPITLNWNTYLV